MIASGTTVPPSSATSEQLDRIVGAAFNFVGFYSYIREQYGKPAVCFLTEAEADDVIAELEVWEADAYAWMTAQVAP